jgi:MoaA/NifB/PqqE/SkfB family radical SAM enzyme
MVQRSCHTAKRHSTGGSTVTEADIIARILDVAGALIGLAICAWTVVALVKAWRGGKTVAKALSPDLLEALLNRLQRLEQSSEAIALQVERIAEGQRFVTKLLSDSEYQAHRLGAPR